MAECEVGVQGFQAMVWGTHTPPRTKPSVLALAETHFQALGRWFCQPPIEMSATPCYVTATLIPFHR